MKATYELWRIIKEQFSDEDFINEYKKSHRSNKENDSSLTKDTAKAVQVG